MNAQDFNFQTDVRVRLNETDAMGICFHGNFFTFMDVGRVDYLRNLDLMEKTRPIKGFDNVVAHAACDFRSPARYDDPLIVRVRISEIRHTSFSFEFLIQHKRENRIVAEGKTVHVAVDGQTYAPIAVPETFKAIIRSFEGKRLTETA